MKKQVINEREIAQKMFKTIRDTKLIHENFGQEREVEPAPQEGAPQESTDGNKVEPSESDVAKSQAEFREIVASDTVFTEYSILPESNNVIFSGKIPGLGNFIFEYLQNEGFAFETEQQITMTDKKLETIQKLTNYFANWHSEMAEKLLEYKGNA